jgi:hypothetical protein
LNDEFHGEYETRHGDDEKPKKPLELASFDESPQANTGENTQNRQSREGH